ncbi:MAG: N-acetylmuramoyl-L-alanine amidase [Thermoleophilia bacterium]|nr:N-acetylmuramoyl-L-alanine amidase [Thermoleophilia bacterium]
MKVAFALFVAFVSAAAPAQAADLRVASRAVAVPAGSSVVAGEAPTRFTLVGVSWRGSGRVVFRTRSLAGRWSEWLRAQPEPGDAPDGPSGVWREGNPWWTGPANGIQYRTFGEVSRIRATFVWSRTPAVPLRRLSYADSPAIIPRRAWAGSDTALRRGKPRYAARLRFAIVHHTAGAGAYSLSESPAIVRAVAAYHVHGNRWDDIGYNFLVDRFGQVFEGRYGGVDRNVIGAHAQGFNAGSVGVALLGTYASTPPSQLARAALAQLLAWRLDVAHVDPLSTFRERSGGNPKYAPGTSVLLRTVAGHRDVYPTSCPGARLYGELPSLAQAVASLGLPKLYEPEVRGAPGGLVRFTARISSSQRWTVTVVDERGGVVATGSGAGTGIDWTWDARAAAFGRYVWTIAAGPTVRPATGTFVGGARGLTLTATAKATTVSPDGDGRADRLVVSYSLGSPAVVTVTVHDAAGAIVATVAVLAKPAGAHVVEWAPDALPDGAYSVVVTAQAGAAVVTASVPLAVNRTLGYLTVSPRAFSPNGDGRADGLSIGYTLAQPADVTVEARRRGAAHLPVFAGSLPAGRHTLAWNGEAAPGVLARDGAYSLVVRAVNVAGVVTHGASVTLDTVAPRLKIAGRSPLRVRVSEPGVLRLTVNGRPVRIVVARAGVVRVTRAGASITAVAEDRAGNRSAPLRLR